MKNTYQIIDLALPDGGVIHSVCFRICMGVGS